MALVLDETVGGAASNSYISQAVADALLEANPFATAWASVTSSNKDMCLVHATSVLDITYDWQGNRTDLDTPQALEWPRTGVYIHDRGVIASNSIPSDIQRATAELAFYYSQKTTQPEDGAGLQNIELPGGLKLGFKESQVEAAETIPDLVRQRITKYLSQSQSVSVSPGISIGIERA